MEDEEKRAEISARMDALGIDGIDELWTNTLEKAPDPTEYYAGDDVILRVESVYKEGRFTGIDPDTGMACVETTDGTVKADSSDIYNKQTALSLLNEGRVKDVSDLFAFFATGIITATEISKEYNRRHQVLLVLSFALAAVSLFVKTHWPLYIAIGTMAFLAGQAGGKRDITESHINKLLVMQNDISTAIMQIVLMERMFSRLGYTGFREYTSRLLMQEVEFYEKMRGRKNAELTDAIVAGLKAIDTRDNVCIGAANESRKGE